MCVPSAAQKGEKHDSFRWVICVGMEVPRVLVKICKIPFTSAEYAMRSPLGDQAGMIWISASVAKGVSLGGSGGGSGQSAAVKKPVARAATVLPGARRCTFRPS